MADTMPRIVVLDRGVDLAEQVRSALANAAGEPEVVACGKVSALSQLLEDEDPFHVLLAGPGVSDTPGLRRLELVRQAYPLMSVVLAFDDTPDASLREVIRTGAVDLLELPADDEEVVTVIERAIEMSINTLAAVPTPEPVIQVVHESTAPAPQGAGRVFTVASATGGCGKTFYATNLGFFLAHHTGLRVCILDLDLQFGEVSTALRLRPKFTIADALEREEDGHEALDDHILEYLETHDTGVYVLAAPKDPVEADRITPPDVARVIESVRRHFDFVIVDTPAQLSDIVMAAMDVSEQLFVLTTLDLPSVRNMSVFLSTLERLKVPTESIRLILNKAESDVGIDIPQVEKLFPQGFLAVLPYAKEVSRSINLGSPVMASSPTAEVSRKMSNAMVELLPVERREAANRASIPEKKKRGLFRRG